MIHGGIWYQTFSQVNEDDTLSVLPDHILVSQWYLRVSIWQDQK